MILHGKTCVVTGAGKGIGRAVAKRFYAEGARLALLTRTGTDFNSLLEELGDVSDRVFCYEGSVGNEQNVVMFIDQTLERFGGIDVLVNNAGMRFRRPFLEITTGEWNEVLQTNLTSIYFLCREVGRVMCEQGRGSIINMASVVGTLGLPELVAYGASKGGMISLTKCLALEWAERGVRVNAIAPAFCESSYMENFKKMEELYSFTLERTPQKRWGSCEEVAGACLFLAGSDSTYITGETLSVDGGWSAW